MSDATNCDRERKLCYKRARIERYKGRLLANEYLLKKFVWIKPKQFAIVFIVQVKVDAILFLSFVKF